MLYRRGKTRKTKHLIDAATLLFLQTESV